MGEFHKVVYGLVILACSSAANLSQAQPVELSAQHHSSEQSARFGYKGYLPEIDELPWNAFAKSGENICSGMIIHKDWILILNSCTFNDANGSNIMVSAGGATPESATQVVNATIHYTTDPLDGFTLLYLNESLAYSDQVQPARIPCGPIGNINYFYGFTSGFANQSNTVQLEAFDTAVFTDLCSNSENLCALGIDWPQPDVNLAGVDFLGGPYMYTDDDTRECILGGRKSYIGNNLTSYYPILNILPTIEKELGLTVEPIPPADSGDEGLCGVLQ